MRIYAEDNRKMPLAVAVWLLTAAAVYGVFALLIGEPNPIAWRWWAKLIFAFVIFSLEVKIRED